MRQLLFVSKEGEGVALPLSFFCPSIEMLSEKGKTHSYFADDGTIRHFRQRDYSSVSSEFIVFVSLSSGRITGILKRKIGVDLSPKSIAIEM
jgi:hypothetical protein